MKAKEMKNLPTEELVNFLTDLTDRIRQHRFKLEFGELKDTTQIRKVRKDIARVKTLLNQRDIKV